MAGINAPYRYLYEHVPASQTNAVLGGTGATGDYLHRLVCTVSTVATSSVQLKDGAGFTHTILPNNVAAVGVYNIEINAASKLGVWALNTGAGVEVIAVGVFSA